MPEPTSSAVAVTVAAAGITIAGLSTGLQPGLLLAGLAGGWWAMTYQPSMPAGARWSAILVSALVAAWCAPAIVAWVTGWEVWPPAVTRELVAYPLAMVMGLLAHRVIGRVLLRIAARRLEEVLSK